MSVIHVLPPQVAASIAAGEVVERPASVVKELVENALDAGATAINVEVAGGGLSLVRVSDNGCGMSRADAPLALERFSTSKIRTLADLSAIRTLGFRGEALAAIAAVARLTILTRTAAELEGTRVTAHDGQVTAEPAASPTGCSVAVSDLFYNTPARRKFLKSPLREAELCQETVVRYALAYPEVAFKLTVDGRERLVAPPATPLERLGLALGREAAAEMLPIAWEAGELRSPRLRQQPGGRPEPARRAVLLPQPPSDPLRPAGGHARAPLCRPPAAGPIAVGRRLSRPGPGVGGHKRPSPQGRGALCPGAGRLPGAQPGGERGAGPFPDPGDVGDARLALPRDADRAGRPWPKGSSPTRSPRKPRRWVRCATPTSWPALSTS